MCWGVSIGRLSEFGALWDCVPRACDVRGGCAGGGVPLGVGLYRILPVAILYGVWHTKGWWWGGHILRNSRAIVLQ